MRVLTVVLIFVALSCASAFSKRNARIAGGKDAKIESYPYQASLQNNGESFCGGAIISSKYIVTSALCVTRDLEIEEVLVGSEKTNEGTKVAVANVKPHPKYDPQRGIFDIGIVELASEITLNAKSQPIALAGSGSDPSAGTSAVVTGYGLLGNRKPAAEKLQRLEIKVMDRDECQRKFDTKFGIFKEMICASSGANSKGACKRDSGDPLNYNGQLIGILSFGYCGNAYPEVYTNIGAVRDFISEATGGL